MSISKVFGLNPGASGWLDKSRFLLLYRCFIPKMLMIGLEVKKKLMFEKHKCLVQNKIGLHNIQGIIHSLMATTVPSLVIIKQMVF